MISQHPVMKTANVSSFVEALLWLLTVQAFYVMFVGKQTTMTTFSAGGQRGLPRQRSQSLQAQVTDSQEKIGKVL